MDSEKVMAIARLAVSLALAIASGFGLALDADALLTGVGCVLALAAFVYSWYKNNNLTDAAVQAQHYLDAIKSKSSEGDD